MAGSSAGLHEDSLSPLTVNHHRAIVSLMEELEAVDWYNQRVEATDDESLAALLAHNRDEEKEHAAMTLEWLRRHDSALDVHLRTYLFTERPVIEIETAAEAPAEPTRSAASPASPDSSGDLIPTVDESLAIGSLRGTRAQ